MDIEKFVMSYIEKLKPEGIINKKEADNRAADFLYAVAIISTERKKLSDERVSVESANKVVYADVFVKQEDKNVTDKKIKTEANPDFIEIRELLENLDNNINYLKTMEKTLENGHIFYRNLYKGD
jgi:hypothetical protein